MLTDIELYSDMADRIAMRESMLSKLAWHEPPGERPDWRVWRSTLSNTLPESEDSESTYSSDSTEQPDLCRSISAFVGYKP
jgi:hypothetical protein